ncbi:hypothetical protein BpHYR1_016139 [Brachionus plicatilis]|uniref:Uncharacterized protein n=1 Tax=Brachionus plicatilis TaxID=10195 RepID=A0A3M7RQ96_BRAPC|nr:hypothetical protein BpHYR1_016139 [Brachionus plicatilis]
MIPHYFFSVFTEQRIDSQTYPTNRIRLALETKILNGRPRVSVFSIVDGALRELVVDCFILDDIIAALLQFSLPIW